MNRWIIRTGVGESFNAASKARRDAEAIAVRRGYQVVSFRGGRTAGRSPVKALHLAAEGVRNWNGLLRTAGKGDIVLLQYPHYPMKSAALMRVMLARGRRKGIRFIALVHDLDSLRGLHGAAAEYCDRQVLPCFDMVICHNAAMKALLQRRGMASERLTVLEAFDYLSEADGNARGEGIAIAGNLDPEKCGYVRKLMERAEVPLHLYGKGLEEQSVPEYAVYHGAFSPEELPERLEGRFGLVWDGDDLSCCCGRAGEYLRYNSPHKLSLYLSAGLPVIIWKEAAEADFIRRNGAGLLLDSLEHLAEEISAVPADEYEKMRRSARRIGAELRGGKMLDAALRRAENDLEGKFMK